MKKIEDYLKTGVTLAPYNYELFRSINPRLTKGVYEFLRGNCSEWKIICGQRVKVKYSNYILEGNTELALANIKVYQNRYIPEYFLNPENWNYGNNRG
jgi:hypothetical protein